MRSSHFTKLFALICGFAMLLTSCQEDDSMIAPQTESSKSILETLGSFDQEISYNIYAQEESNARWGYGQGKKKGFAKRAKKVPTFFTLSTALKETGLFKTVVKNKLTVFAPTDDAFAALGLNPSNVGDVPGIENILLYHVVPGLVFARDLEEGYVSTVNGASAQISLDGGVFINASQVIAADIRALNSVIHVIDQVLLPPTLADLVMQNENFSILKLALETANLVGALENADAGLTVFAPTNAAFVALLGELGLTAEQLLASPALGTVLLYHVFQGEVFSTDLSDGLKLSMLDTGSITFDLSGPTPLIIDVNEREVPLNTGLLDIKATNGVIHVIDRVLTTEELAPLLP